MAVSGRRLRSAGVGVIAVGAMLIGGASLAYADPAPNCTAADLAVASGTVGTAMGDYLFTHPVANDFFRSLKAQPYSQIHDLVQPYMDAHLQVESKIKAIRQPLTDLRSRCDLA